MGRFGPCRRTCKLRSSDGLGLTNFVRIAQSQAIAFTDNIQLCAIAYIAISIKPYYEPIPFRKRNC